MAVYPTPGGSDGTWGTETSAFHGITKDLATGKILSTAVMDNDNAPTVDAGLANKKYVDDQLTSSSGAIKAWVSFDGDTGAINGTGYNITSVVRNSEGDYTITWDTDFANTNYVIAGFTADATQGIGIVGGVGDDTPFLVGSARIQTRNISNLQKDYNLVTVMAIGDQ